MKANVQIEVNLDSPEKVEAFKILMGFDSPTSKTSTGVYQTEEDRTTTPPMKKEKTEKKPKKKKSEETKTEEPKSEKSEPKKSENEENTSIDEVREILSLKVKEHRVVIKNKLSEFGAKNVSTLSEEYYEDFVEFLKTL